MFFNEELVLDFEIIEFDLELEYFIGEILEEDEFLFEILDESEMEEEFE